jgi:CheY-like chemotaxis protein
LLGVINGVLDLSKIEAGKVELERSAFDLRTVVEEVTELLSELAYGKGLELACFVPANLPTALVGDPGRLRQILTNLIGNAIKFTERGEVSVRAYLMERDPSSTLIAFEVADTGIGIPPKQREHIFEAFAQADSSTTRRYGGSGLGLSIAKHFCEMMGGSIEVTSKPGSGSEFRFTARFGLQRRPVSLPANNSPPGSGIAALVVVDHGLIREILDDHLSAWNVPFQLARTGGAALEMLCAEAARQAPFALAIIDNSISDMKGTELARSIRSSPAIADLPIVLLTSFDQDIGKIGEGILKRLTKPIRRSTLWDCLAGVSAEAAPPPPKVAAALVSDELELGRPHVLLVEDSPVNLEVGVAILESMGCRVETAVNGLRALDRHANDEFDLIFMDCQMPEMDGFQTTIEIRRRESVVGRHTPIVALTASVVEDGRQRCLAVGMDDYLAKPFTLEQMRAMLAAWLIPRARTLAPEQSPFVTASPSVAEAIDDRVLDSLRRLQREGRPDIVQQVIELFFKGAADLLKDLDNGAANDDPALLFHASHALKSASANIGAVVLSSRCRELEAMARAGVVPDAARLVRAIREDFRTVETGLSERLPRVA